MRFLSRNVDIQAAAEEARKSISSYCVEDCKAYCCRKGFLLLDEAALQVTVGDQRLALERQGFLKETKEGFSLNLNNPRHCPSLKGSLCTIHKNPDRSRTCKDFPIFIREKSIILSHRCPAVQEEKFYAFVQQCLADGWRLDETGVLRK